MTIKEAVKNYKMAQMQDEKASKDAELIALDDAEEDLKFIQLKNSRYPMAQKSLTYQVEVIKAIAEVIPSYRKLNPLIVAYHDEMFKKIMGLAERIA